MDSTRLFELFRSDVADEAKPYLWKDIEVWEYMDSAHKAFVRLTGGIADFTSSITEVSATANEPTSEVSKRILRFMYAQRTSDNRPVEIINSTDIGRLGRSDYGSNRPFTLSDQVGPVVAMVIGMQRGIVRWVNVPEADDTIKLRVYRLPLNDITGDAQEFVDIDDQHHIYLLNAMKALAYRKQDAETFDRARAEENEVVFARYCALVKSEFEREKHKTRVVAYGGL